MSPTTLCPLVDASVGWKNWCGLGLKESGRVIKSTNSSCVDTTF